MTFARLTFAAIAFAAASAATAADQYGRLTVDVKVDGKTQSQRGKDWSRGTISESMHLAFTVMRSGDGDDMNLLDHAGNNAAMAKQMEASRARAPSQAKQQEIMANMQKQLAACKNDVNCMQAIALKMGRETASWSAPAPDRSGDEGRYFNYIQVEPALCKAEFSARINNNVEGAYADVAGMRPFATKVTADFKAGELEKATVCIGGVTVDARTGKLTTQVSVPEVKGRYLGTDNGRVQQDNQNAKISLNAEAMRWALSQLNGGARSGTQRTTLKVPATNTMTGDGEQVLNVEVRWSFDGK